LLGQVSVEDEVEVDEAGALGWGGGAVAAHFLFDGEEGLEESFGGEGGFEERGGVEEVGLVEVADGGGVVEGGDGGEGAKGGEVVEGEVEVGGAVAEVGAEGYGGYAGFRVQGPGSRGLLKHGRGGGWLGWGGVWGRGLLRSGGLVPRRSGRGGGAGRGRCAWRGRRVRRRPGPRCGGRRGLGRR